MRSLHDVHGSGVQGFYGRASLPPAPYPNGQGKGLSEAPSPARTKSLNVQEQTDNSDTRGLADATPQLAAQAEGCGGTR